MYRVVFAILLAACGSRPARPPVTPAASAVSIDEARAREFVTYLLDVLERRDLAAWIELQSYERQQVELDRARQLEAWREDLLPRAGELRDVQFWIDRDVQTFLMYRRADGQPAVLAMIAEEADGLRIDET